MTAKEIGVATLIISLLPAMAFMVSAGVRMERENHAPADPLEIKKSSACAKQKIRDKGKAISNKELIELEQECKKESETRRIKEAQINATK